MEPGSFYEKHGVPVPESLAHVVVTNQVGAGIGGGVPNHGVFSASQSPASSPNRSSPGSNPCRLGYPYMQAEIAEGLAILRGIKRSMQARQMWVEAEEQQNPCSQQ